MFGQLVFVRLRAAEKALKAGRLDEAYRLATALDLRDHRRAMAVLESLTPPLIERARQHYREDRLTEALRDLDWAEAGGAMRDELAELRGHVLTVATSRKASEDDQRKRLDAALRRVERGSLDGGRRILKQADREDGAAHKLREELDLREQDLAGMIQQARALMDQGQWAGAAGRIRQAKSIQAHDEAITEIEAKLCEEVVATARRSFEKGKLRRTKDELACLGELGTHHPEKREVSDLLAIAARAATCLKGDRYTEGRRHLMTLARLVPQVKWVAKAIGQLMQVDGLKTDLMGGPLGEELEATMGAQDHVAKKASMHDTLPLPKLHSGGDELPRRLLVLIDGGGSFLLVRSERVSIGRVVTDHPADVPIFGDLGEMHAMINRVDDDYFLASEHEVEVGGRKTRSLLMRDAQRVVLGRKAKFTFRLPSRRSSSAVLDLSDTTKMPNDVRRVVLFRHHATIGIGPSAHLRCMHASPPLVLFERRGSLWIRPKSDGHVDNEAKPLPLGEPVEINGVSLVVQPWTVRTAASS